MRSRTRYAKSGGVNIAYQAVGGGDLDLVFVPGWVSHVEQVWEEPHFGAFLDRLASYSRLILIDRAGTGLSDPVTHLPTLEERADEVRAVMDAAGSSRAALLGVSEGGPMCAYFAATCPERTAALVLLNTYAAVRRSDEIPWGMPEATIEAFIRSIEQDWGSGVSVNVFAPSLAGDAAFLDGWSRIERYAVSPGTAHRLLAMAAELVDSTRRVAEIGDHAWKDLLARFYELVRGEVARFRGRELDTAGDGYLATFDGPARAIRCARALREGVRGLGLELRQGLHTGECEVIGGKLSGLAVHIGARVAAEAGPDEILVSGTVKDLVVGSDLAFEDRASRVLKGVPGEWRLHAAV